MNRRGSFWLNWLKGLDYFAATCCGIPAGIYVSSYVLFKRWLWSVRLINWLFSDSRHCSNSLNHNLEDIKYYYGE